MNNLKKQLKEAFGNKQKLFCDMDGVLCDLMKAFQRELMKNNEPVVSIDEYQATHGRGAVYNVFERGGKDFWANLEWMPNAKEYWNYINSNFDVYILTAVSKVSGEAMIQGKLDWIKNNLGISDRPNFSSKTWTPDKRIIFNPNKHMYCKSPDDILVDDHEKNINNWVKKGGVGILYKSADQVVQELKNLTK